MQSIDTHAATRAAADPGVAPGAENCGDEEDDDGGGRGALRATVYSVPRAGAGCERVD